MTEANDEAEPCMDFDRDEDSIYGRCTWCDRPEEEHVPASQLLALPMEQIKGPS